MKKSILMIILVCMISILFIGCNSKQETKKEPETKKEQPNENVNNKDDSDQIPDVELPRKGLIEAVKKLPEKKIKLSYLGYKNNEFWIPVEEGVLAAKEYLKNFNCDVEWVIMGEDINAENCIAAIETTITKKYDGFAIVPINDGTFEYMNKAVDRGIPVVSVIAEGSEKASGLIESKALAFMGTDAYAAGQQAGKLIEELTGGEGKIGVITGYFTAPQHEARRMGAVDYLEENCPDIEIIATVENQDDTLLAYSAAKDFFTKAPDLKLIYGCAGGAQGAAEAIKDLGLKGKAGLVCYDHIPVNIDYAREGYIWAALDQQPYENSFNALVYLYNNIVAGEEPPVDENGDIYVTPTVMTPDNVDELYPE